MNQLLKPQQTPHTSPSCASYGVYIVRIGGKLIAFERYRTVFPFLGYWSHFEPFCDLRNSSHADHKKWYVSWNIHACWLFSVSGRCILKPCEPVSPEIFHTQHHTCFNQVSRLSTNKTRLATLITVHRIRRAGVCAIQHNYIFTFALNNVIYVLRLRNQMSTLGKQHQQCIQTKLNWLGIRCWSFARLWKSKDNIQYYRRK